MTCAAKTLGTAVGCMGDGVYAIGNGDSDGGRVGVHGFYRLFQGQLFELVGAHQVLHGTAELGA